MASELRPLHDDALPVRDVGQPFRNRMWGAFLGGGCERLLRCCGKNTFVTLLQQSPPGKRKGKGPVQGLAKGLPSDSR